jgi:DHA2 family multidrug resistance protein
MLGGVAAAPIGATTVPALGASQVRWLLVGLSAATGMEFYTFDSVNLVLADLTGTLGLSTDEASWILTVYSSALFLFVPVSIWLAGYVGHKRFLIATILVYAAASIGCALSPDLSAMLIARAVQGASGAGLVVWWRASIYVLLPKAQRSPSLMRVSTGLYLSSALGLIAGGAIIDHFNWRLVFVPSIAYAAFAILMLRRHFPNQTPHPPAQMEHGDWPGIILVGIGLAALQIVLSRGEIDDWFGAPNIRVLGWLSAVSLGLFVVWQTSALNPSPLLRLGLFADRNVVAAATIGICTGMILSGSLFVLPEFLRNVADSTLSATQTGAVVAVYALTAAAIRPLMVGVIARLGQRKTICLALLALILSMLLFNRHMTVGSPASEFYMPLMLYAVCLTSLLPSIGSGTVGRLEQKKLLDGVALYMIFRQLGASLGVALLTILIAHRETSHAARLYEHLQANAPATAQWLTRVSAVLTGRGGYTAADAPLVATKLLAQVGARQVTALSYADAFLFMAVVGAGALLLVPLIPTTPIVAKK